MKTGAATAPYVEGSLVSVESKASLKRIENAPFANLVIHRKLKTSLHSSGCHFAQTNVSVMCLGLSSIKHALFSKLVNEPIKYYSAVAALVLQFSNRTSSSSSSSVVLRLILTFRVTAFHSILSYPLTSVSSF